MEVAQSSTSSSPSAIYQALSSCGVVLASNLSFSFRGLYHKKIRAFIPSAPPSNNRNHRHHGISGVGGSSGSNNGSHTLTHATDTDLQYQTSLDGLVIMTIIWIMTDTSSFKLILSRIWNWIYHIVTGTSAANVPLTLNNASMWENTNQYILSNIVSDTYLSI